MNVYIAGNMLTKDSQMLRAQERREIEALHIPLYNPMDQKDINDKANVLSGPALCDAIVAKDTDALMNCTHVVIEPQPYAIGTMIELGQLLGYKQIAESILGIVSRMREEGIPESDILGAVLSSVNRHYRRKVYPHYEDIRRQNQTETGDYRSLGLNAYLVGACRQLTGNAPFYEWDEVLEELRWDEVQERIKAG